MIAVFADSRAGYPSVATQLRSFIEPSGGGINDSRESPAIKIIEELANLGADVRVYDPFVPSLATKAGVFLSAGSIEEALSGAECAVFLVDHDVFRGISMETMKGLMAAPVIVDGKNLFAGGGEGIVYMGIGKGER